MAVVVTELIRFPITLARQAINFPYERRRRRQWLLSAVGNKPTGGRQVRHFCAAEAKIDPFDYSQQQQQQNGVMDQKLSAASAQVHSLSLCLRAK